MPMPKGFKHSSETKEKIRKSVKTKADIISSKLKYRYRNDTEFRENHLLHSFKIGHKTRVGKRHSKIFKERQSDRLKKLWANPEFINKMTLRHHPSGRKNHRWKNGRFKMKSGYIVMRKPTPPFGAIYEHRYIIEQTIGRKLKPSEHIHHLNEIKDDNRVENLILLSSNSAHRRFHKDPDSVTEEEIIFDGRIILR